MPYYQILDESLASGWSWSERFPKQPEIRAYFNYIDQKLCISKCYDFNTTVISADFDERGAVWNISLSDGRVHQAQWFIAAVGFSSKLLIPNLKGADKFKGTIHHTGDWPRAGLDARNKRVAVIGTGTSAAQLIQEIAPSVTSLTVYQRSPAVAIPLLAEPSPGSDVNGPPTKEENQVFARKSLNTYSGLDYTFSPDGGQKEMLDRDEFYDYLYRKGGWHLLLSNWKGIWHDRRANADVYRFWSQKCRAKIQDPVKRELLVPLTSPTPIGVKRPCLIDNYYQTFNRQNVTLVDINQNPLQGITETGIQSSESHQQYDIIILATGFQSLASGILDMNITGRHGLRLADLWGTSANSYLGLTAPGFPNMFYLNGPAAPNPRANAPTVIEFQAQWLGTTLDNLRGARIKVFEPTATAAQEWREELTKQWRETLYPFALSMQTRNHLGDAHELYWYVYATVKERNSSADTRRVHGVNEYGSRLRRCQAPEFPGFKLEKYRADIQSVSLFQRHTSETIQNADRT